MAKGGKPGVKRLQEKWAGNSTLLGSGDRLGGRRWYGWRTSAPEENGPVRTTKRDGTVTVEEK